MNIKYGNTVIMVTHNEAIRHMADHVDQAARRGSTSQMRSTRIKFQRQIWNGKECDRHEEEEKTRNPLIRRIPRELAGDWRKYLLVSLFLILTIGFVSGMYVANESMMKAADEGVTKYKLEDGHFELNEEADQTLPRCDCHRRESGCKAVLHGQGKA